MSAKLIRVKADRLFAGKRKNFRVSGRTKEFLPLAELILQRPIDRRRECIRCVGSCLQQA
ncbi:MAG: hypothetical protein WBX00_07585 [Isosphaeraceae bacterium]